MVEQEEGLPIQYGPKLLLLCCKIISTLKKTIVDLTLNLTLIGID